MAVPLVSSTMSSDVSSVSLSSVYEVYFATVTVMSPLRMQNTPYSVTIPFLELAVTERQPVPSMIMSVSDFRTFLS